MGQEVGGGVQSWTERRLMVRSVRQAQAAEAALRARVAKAMAQIEALNQRGRGKKRVEDVSALRQAVVAIVQRYGVERVVSRRNRSRGGCGTPLIITRARSWRMCSDDGKTTSS